MIDVPGEYKFFLECDDGCVMSVGPGSAGSSESSLSRMHDQVSAVELTSGETVFYRDIIDNSGWHGRQERSSAEALSMRGGSIPVRIEY